MPLVAVTSKGQVTIPKRIRQELGIAKGSQVEFELAEGGARMRLVRQGAASRIEDGPDILAYSGRRIPVSELQGQTAAKKMAGRARR